MKPILVLTLSFLLTLVAVTAQEYTLTIEQPAHGTISVSPEMATYPRGTELTLTATPDEGYRVIDLIVLRSGAGNENSRGRAYEENPRTFTINQNTELRATIVPEITPNVLFDNLAVRGDDPNGSGSAWKTTFDRARQHLDRPILVAQRFQAAESGNVTAVEFGFARVGSPGGRLILDIREVDESTGHPGELVGAFATFEVDNAKQIVWCNALQLKLEPVRVEGLVSGLEPGKDYFLHIAQAEDDLGDNHPGVCAANPRIPVIDLVSFNGVGQVGEAQQTLFDWPVPDEGIPAGWLTYDPNNSLTMRFRIEESDVPTHTLTIPVENGTVTKSPDLQTYPAGTEVTLTATPNEGYEFTKWLIGETEFTENPLTITIEADTTMTPEFVAVPTEVIVYDTSTFYDAFEIRWATEIWGADELISQPFFTGDADSIVSVSIDARIFTGRPTGTLVIEVWEDDGKGLPGQKIETLGSVSVEDLPAAPKRPVVLTTIEGEVSGLLPQTHYHLVVNHKDAIFHPPYETDKLMYMSCRAEPVPTGAGHALGFGEFTDNEWWTWQRIHEGGAGTKADRRFFVMTILGTRSEPESHTLTIPPIDQGTVTRNPDLETYPAGTEVTLTATPNEGYEFTKWLIGETEFTDNPLTITIEKDTAVTPEFVALPNVIVHYSNLDDDGGAEGRSLKAWPTANNERWLAQQFTAATDNVSEVSIALARAGSPGGKLTLSIWSLNPTTGRPGTQLGILGELEIESLPVLPSLNDSALPAFLDFAKVIGQVTGLEAGTDYFLHIEASTGTSIGNNKAWIFSMVGTPAGAKDALVLVNGQWTALAPLVGFSDGYLHAEIVGKLSTHTLTIAPGDGGEVIADPNLPTYPAGTEVTLTAAPNEGYEFAGWTATKQTGEPEAATVFDNLDHPRDEFISTFDKRYSDAQQFLMKGNRSLSQVEVEQFRLGTISGSIAFELWSDNGSDQPDEKIADIGIIEDVSVMPTSDTRYSFGVAINGLEPNGKYWVVRNHQGITSAMTGSNTIGWPFSFSTDGTEGAAGSQGRDPSGTWTDFTEIFPQFQTLILQMRVQTVSSPPAEPLELPNENPVVFTIDADTVVTAAFTEVSATYTLTRTLNDGGMVTADPDLETYPAGTEVTVTATPNEGYVLAGWSGDTNEEGNPRIITLTMDGDKNVTATFRLVIVPEIAGVVFDPVSRSVSLTWPSHSDAIYEIEMSTDLVAWELLETKLGTGERTTAVVNASPDDVGQRFYRLREKS